MKKTIQSKDFQRLAGAFDKFVKVRNYKQGRSNLYKNIITEFLIWLEESGITKIQNVTSKESVKYLEYPYIKTQAKREWSSVREQY